jgi:hypothetical protein
MDKDEFSSGHISKFVCPFDCPFFKMRIQWLHKVTKRDTQILIKANTYNKTSDLDIFLVRLSRRSPGFESP